MKLKVMVFIVSALLLCGSETTAQTSVKKITVTGRVTDSRGTPVKGAMILIDKKNSGILTNAKGTYRVRIKPGAVMISAFTRNSGNGEKQINGSTSVDITLSGIYMPDKESVRTDADESVNVGYGSVNKEEMTTPVNKIKVDRNNNAGYRDIYDMILGKVPGVEVHGKSIKIQGSNSFMASTEPLFVVDGMVVPTIDEIMPVDVKSIEVLKGAAASVYGSRGANGVILITLKGAGDRK